MKVPEAFRWRRRGDGNINGDGKIVASYLGVLLIVFFFSIV